jgi:exopolysaccharide biosynthesis polyprenyl glycosylphosphotransferase
MLRDRAEFARNVMYVLDLIVVSINFFLIYLVLLHFRSFHLEDVIPAAEIVRVPASLGEYLQAYWLVLIVWGVLLKQRGEYRHLRLQTYGRAFMGLLVSCLIFFVSFTSLAFLLKFNFLSRFYILLYTLTSALWLLVNRLGALWVAHEMRSRGYNAHYILVVGTGRRAQEYLSLALRHKEWGYRIVGFIDKDPKITGKKIAEYPVLGSLDDLPKILETMVIDEVAFIVPRAWLPTIEKCVLYCEAVGIPATLATDFFDLEIASGVPRQLDGFTYLTFETRRLKHTELLVKRTMDIVVSFVILLFCLPLFAVIAVAIRLDSKGPVFFSQLRSGPNGRKIKVYKFRSMVQGAESRRDELTSQNEMSGPVFKITNDPRLTPVGRILRRTSLDEFPQFWNVLKGDMSIVGPRPLPVKEAEQCEPWQRRRQSMKPGITCIWQVSGRNQIGFEDWMKLDLRYIDRWSLWLDFKILAQTVQAVFKLTGK